MYFFKNTTTEDKLVMITGAAGIAVYGWLMFVLIMAIGGGR